MKKARFDLYQAKDGWRWRLLAKNGRIVAESGEAYVRKSGAIQAIARARQIGVVAEGPDLPEFRQIGVQTLASAASRYN